MTTTQIKNFAAFVQGTQIGYDAIAKDRFKRESCAILRQIAKLMGLPKGSYEVRYNPGGIAVSGDPILHSDPIDGRGGIYVNMSPTNFGEGASFYYRSCKDRKDYTGGRNHWIGFDKLVKIETVACIFKEAALANV